MPATRPFSIRSRLAAGVCALAVSAWPQLKWPGCPDLKSSDFRITTLVSGTPEILHMDLDLRGRIYFTQRLGLLRRFDPATGKTTDLAKIPVNTHLVRSYQGRMPAPNHNGLLGVALHPDFARNGWIFVSYHSVAPGDSAQAPIRVSRFTVAGDRIDPKSEKIILQSPFHLAGEHTGGPLLFAENGDLYIALGDNSLSGCGVTV